MKRLYLYTSPYISAHVNARKLFMKDCKKKHKKENGQT